MPIHWTISRRGQAGPAGRHLRLFHSFGLPLLTLALSSSLALLSHRAVIPLLVWLGPVQVRQGQLRYDVRDADTGESIPAKLTLLGIAGSADPLLTRFDIGRQEGDAIVAYNRVMSATGLGVVPVPAGTYDVFVSRGPEWDLHIARGVRVGPLPSVLSVALHHVVDSAGYLSADFHVHSSCSPDSTVPMKDRVYEFLSDGVEIIAATDHNKVCDYAPFIREIGADRLIAGITGAELTTPTWGHFGAFPLPLGACLPDPAHLPEREPAEVFSSLRRDYPGAIINVNHPRLDALIGYFNLGGLDVAADRADRRGFSFDFDAMEILNGFQDGLQAQVDQVMADWFTLLNHGHLITATGNSDTHHLNYNLGGYPRNYVRVAADRPDRMEAGQMADALRAHHAFFTTAPFVRLRVGGGEIGDLVPARGVVSATIEVQAAPWVAVSQVRIYVNGHKQQDWHVAPGTAPLRFRAGFDVRADRDTWVVARVDGDRPLSPVVGETGAFVVWPLALTNPVFLDADGDGVFTAPLAGGAP